MDIDAKEDAAVEAIDALYDSEGAFLTDLIASLERVKTHIEERLSDLG